MVWTFDITWSTHDLLKVGVTEARTVGGAVHLGGQRIRHRRVVVLADDRDTAALIAAQLASCGSGRMCTGVYDRI